MTVKRKEFLKIVGAGAVVGLGQLAITACKSTSAPAVPTTSKTFTSTLAGSPSHSHTFLVNQSEVTSPPAGGISRATSDYGGHSHTFTMSQADLTTVMGGGSVTLDTSTEAPAYNTVHFHSFTISKWFAAQNSILGS
jgi:hypothetical protein